MNHGYAEVIRSLTGQARIDAEHFARHVGMSRACPQCRQGIKAYLRGLARTFDWQEAGE